MKRTGACFLGGTLFLLLAMAALRHCFPALPNPLRLEARFDAAVPGRSDPIVVTGACEVADFIFVRFLPDGTAVFGYDSWGLGGAVSAPVKLAPGVAHRLEITMPSLGQSGETSGAQTGPLRVSCDGVEILDSRVSSHWRTNEQIFIGTNPLGGTSCGLEFHGTLRGPDGRVLRGGARSIFSARERIAAFWTDGLWRVWPLLLVVAALVWAVLRRPGAGRAGPPTRRPWAAIAAGSLCLLGFAYCITDGSFRFIYPESFGSFYDYQAVSLLHGRLDVPRTAIGDEAFVFHGKDYGYFGVTPALLRLPFVALDWGFGELSRSFMCADFLACLVFSFLILRQAIRLRQGFGGQVRVQDGVLATPTPWAGFLFVAAAGIGSPLFFLGGRAYVYHEAILCGAAFALAGCYCTLRYLAEPERRWWLGALACGLLSTHARPSSGFFALSFTGFAALAHLIRKRPVPSSLHCAATTRRGLHLLVGAGCVLGVLSFNGMGYLKFHTFDGAPFKYHIQYNSVRLNRFGGRNFHLVNLPFNFESYLTAPTFKFLRTFPFFYCTGRDFMKGGTAETGLAPVDQALGLARNPKMDMVEPMLGLTYAMPGLCLLALFGVFCAWTRDPEIRRPVAILWVAAVPFTLAMFMAVATAERYTADFCPFLITAAAFGLAAVEAARKRALACAAVAILTLWSAFAMVALTLHFQGVEVWGVPDEARKNYQNLSQSVDRFFHLSDHDSN